MNEITKNNKQKIPVMRGQYGLYQRRFNAYIRKNNLPIEPQSVRSYLDSLSDMSASTQRLAKTSIKQALERATANPVAHFQIEREFKKIKTKKPDRKILEYLQKKEIDYLKRHASERVAMLIELLAQSGLRISELLGVKLDDIQRVNGVSRVRVLGKGKKERTIYLDTTSIEDAKKTYNSKTYLIESVNGNRYNRRTAYELFTRLSNRLGIKFTPHSFRHSYASRQILEKDKNIKAVSQYLGHSTTAITADMYLHNSLKPAEAVLL